MFIMNPLPQDSNDAVVFVIIHYKESMKPYLNGILITDDCSIVLAFEPKTKAYKALINEVPDVALLSIYIYMK